VSADLQRRSIQIVVIAIMGDRSMLLAATRKHRHLPDLTSPGLLAT